MAGEGVGTGARSTHRAAPEFAAQVPFLSPGVAASDAPFGGGGGGWREGVSHGAAEDSVSDARSV